MSGAAHHLKPYSCYLLSGSGSGDPKIGANCAARSRLWSQDSRPSLPGPCLAATRTVDPIYHIRGIFCQKPLCDAVRMVTLCNRCRISRTYQWKNLNEDYVPQGGDMELCYVKRAPVSIIAVLMLAACGKQEPRSIDYFMSHEYAMESALVRCSADRDAARRDPECINARIANDRMAATEEETKRQAAEREFERMRGSIRERQNRQQQARVRAEQEAAKRAATIPSPSLNARATATPSRSGSGATYQAPTTTTPQYTTPQAGSQTSLAELQRLEAQRRSAEQATAQETLRLEEQRRLAEELAASEALRMQEQRRLTEETAARRLVEQRALQAEQEKAVQLRAEIEALRATREAESAAIRRAAAERLEQERLAREAEQRRIAAEKASEAARIQGEIQALEEERRRQQQEQEEAYRAQRELEARLEALKQSSQDNGS